MLLIKNGNVYLGRGKYEPGWDVLCRDGKIEAVGPGLTAAEAKTVDAAGLDVYPGLVLGMCSVGATGLGGDLGDDHTEHNDTFSPMAPQLDILDALDMTELKRQRYAANGITSFGLSPGAKALISGQISLIHVDGQRKADVILAQRIALKANHVGDIKYNFFMRSPPNTRMAMHQMLDEAFRAAQEYMSLPVKPFYDPGKEVLARCLKGEIPFFAGAYALRDVESVMAIAEKYNLRLVITGAFGVERAGEEIIEKGWHVMLGDSNCWCRGATEGTSHEALVDLYRKGLKLSIYSSGEIAYLNGYEQLYWVAAQMRAAGAEAWEVMDMMTAAPAEALGVSHLVGSLEAGKYADVILCKGNPADRFDNYVEKTFVAGRLAYTREGQ